MQIKPFSSLENHERCPVCKNKTLPPIKPDSQATGRACAYCHSVVNREGVIETVSSPTVEVGK